MKKAISLVVMSLMFISISHAQGMTVKADSVIANVGDSVTVPINFSNFGTVGSITLYINYNASYLSWGRGLNWHAGVLPGQPLINASGNTIIISWADAAGAIVNGKLVDLKFQFNGGSSTLAFSANCEVTTPMQTILFPSYINGLVKQALTVSMSASQSTICMGANTQLFTTASYGFGNYTYSWSSVPPGFTSNLPNPIVVPGTTTIYTVTVSDGVNMASASQTIEIYGNPPPSAVLGLLPAGASANLTKPFTFSWFPSLFATSYEIYLWKSGDPVPSAAWKTTSQISYVHYTDLLFGTTYNWKVVAKNICYQTSSAVQTFTTRFLPDLIVNSVQVPTSAYSGQNFTLTWEVKNQGSGGSTSQPWYDRVYLSTDTTLETAVDINLGQVSNLSYLDVNQSYVQSESFVLPLGISGNYYLFVHTDANNHLLEENDNNNIKRNTTALLVTLTPPPDLQVSSIITPNNTFSGLSINVTWTVKNYGSGATTSTYWQDRIYLSTDDVFDVGNATNIGTFFHSGALLANDTYSKTESFLLPANVFGTYYVYVQTDFFNQVYEHATENNNVGQSDSINVFLTPPPDLQVTSISHVGSASNKESVSLTYTVQNLGGSATPSHFYDKIWLVNNATGDMTNAIDMGTFHHYGVLNPGDSYARNYTYTIPSVSGPYYFYVKTDYNNTVFEHLNENNNTSQSSTAIQINNPDLIVSNVSIPAQDNTGNPIPVSWTIKNIGTGSVLSTSWKDRVMLSYIDEYFPNSVTQLGLYTSNVNLAPGDSFVVSKMIAMPQFVHGPYYIFVYTDYQAHVFEGLAENNNTKHSNNMLEIIRPDLIVSSVNGPSTGMSGQTITLDWVVKNNGITNLASGTWTDRVLYSKSQEYYPDSVIMVANIPNAGPLAAGDSIPMSETVQLPNGVTGTFYMAVYTDFNNTIFENNSENNNVTVSFTPIVVSEGPWPDLQVTGIVHADSSSAGLNIPFAFTVSNMGTFAAQGHAWIDKIYISNNPIWTAGTSTLVRTINRLSPLPVSSSYTISTNINIPTNLLSGYYYLFVYTDATDSIFENTNNFNNVQQLAPIYISQYPPVDLAGIAFTVPTAVNSGTVQNVDWTIKNLGQATTLTSFWYDQVYLSVDTFWNATSDIFVYQKKKFGPLPPGATYTLTENITIPNGLSGNYYFILVADKNNLNNDADFSNNIFVARDGMGDPLVTTITLTPPPDLQVTSFTGPTSGFSGQGLAVNWTVTNNGVGATSVSAWTDKFYLSTDFQIGTGDILIGTHNHTGALYSTGSYSSSLNLNIPISAYGNYIIIVKTDINDVVYEHTNESNNTAYYFATIILPPPCDLIVADISAPTSGIAGKSFTLNYTLENIGLNPASGLMKDIIYFSKDPVWDIGDPVFSSKAHSNTINPQAQYTYSVTADLNNVSVGDYYVIVKTDILNNINESDKTNNSMVSVDLVNVNVSELPLNTLIVDTLVDFEELYYRIEIDDTLVNETLFAQLKGDSINGNNEFYIRFGDIPTRVEYDYSHDNPFLGNQEILIPNLQMGTYYILVYGNSLIATEQEISLWAEILDFEILSVVANQGGNTGEVTVKMRGSKFDASMNISLQNGTDTITATSVHFVDPTLVYPTFDLTGASPGFYDVVADGWLFIPVTFTQDSITFITSQEIIEATAILEDGFEVVAGSSPNLQVNVVQPANTRANSIVSMSIEFTNAGNVDLLSPTVVLNSLAGTPLSFTVSGLANLITELEIILSESNGPPGILRPGVSGSIVIYSKSSAGLGFSLTLPNNL